MRKILKRLQSPVVWVTALTSVYTYVELADFSTARGIVLSVIGILIACFAALNNPTDREHM